MAKTVEDLIGKAAVETSGKSEIIISQTQIGDLIVAVCARLNELGVEKHFSMKRRDGEFRGHNLNYDTNTIDAKIVLHLHERSREQIEAQLQPALPSSSGLRDA